jgi:hypothetical protein
MVVAVYCAQSILFCCSCMRSFRVNERLPGAAACRMALPIAGFFFGTSFTSCSTSTSALPESWALLFVKRVISEAYRNHHLAWKCQTQTNCFESNQLENVHKLNHSMRNCLARMANGDSRSQCTYTQDVSKKRKRLLRVVFARHDSAREEPGEGWQPRCHARLPRRPLVACRVRALTDALLNVRASLRCGKTSEKGVGKEWSVMYRGD